MQSLKRQHVKPRFSNVDAKYSKRKFSVSRGRSTRFLLNAGWSLVTALIVASGVALLVLTPVTPPPVDRGHDCTWDKWGCK